ncbi:uncharacterized protein DUF3800 [Curtobacterium sp. AG1037]|uniref:DUF3800 domain-containing protein n=1 Tax=Curtobacterium sp. AG1037 TaxID=2183990 RepID=UPI000E0C1F54|nr:DUF3800 domain-containing protein [Curtobacterium sp. AG1037]RDH95063.1 uncharacterized protein DUF3800 [Curtobacterium sp. AG1037]
MLLAYIDEIGETGAFVSRDHARFRTSPSFGYAGFVIPEGEARRFGALFAADKAALFRSEIAAAQADPGRWERKGSDIFRPDTYAKYPHQIRVFNGLVSHVKRLGGNLFYYADEKPIGTPKQVVVDPADREKTAMQETLNRIARYADEHDQNVMVVIDQINEKTRAERLPRMYGHIYARAADFPEMRRIVEPPMHVDSKLSSNIQFADWVAACVTRAIDYQLLDDSPYQWVTSGAAMPALHGSFTNQSKLHLWRSSVKDLHHYDVFHSTRVMGGKASNLTSNLSPADWTRMKAAAERARQRAAG